MVPMPKVALATLLMMQTASFTYPQPRKSDVVDTLHGVKVADP